jgi:hypothetical protein
MRTLQLLGTSAAVYGLMAACGSEDSLAPFGSSAATSGTGGSTSSGADATSTSGASGAPSSTGEGAASGAGGVGGQGGSGAQGGQAGSGGAGEGGVSVGQGGMATSSSSGPGGGASSSATNSSSSGTASSSSTGGPSTRLKPKYIAGTDGSKYYVPNVLYDTQRMEDCGYATAADGVRRCLPKDMVATSIGYKDAACTKPFVWVSQPPPGCTATAPAYVATTDPPPLCATPSYEPPKHVYPTLTLTSLPNVYGYQLVNGSCVPSGGGPLGNLPFDVGAEIPPASFVDGTTGNDP